METYQILVPLIALLFLGVSIAQHVKGKNTITELLFWIAFWLLVIVLALFPDFVTGYLARLLGIKSNVNAIIFLAIGILFFLQLRMYFIIKRQSMLITDLVRKIALKDGDKEQDGT